MNKLWIIPLAVMMIVPALGAATPIVQTTPVAKRLVEGHTVFAVIQQETNTTTLKSQFAAAVAVLVRERTANTIEERFPGVLWFNDQYLVDPSDNVAGGTSERFPCTGVVAADNQGDFLTNPVDPGTPGVPDTFGANNVQASATYVESYLITDPNDHQWTVDKWDVAGGAGTVSLWTVALLGNDGTASTPDDGASGCSPDTEATYSTPVPCGTGDGTVALGAVQQNPGHCDSTAAPGDSGSPAYPTTGTVCNAGGGLEGGNGCDLKYNAVLFFFLEDLTVDGGNILHCSSQTSYTQPAGCSTDVSGCYDGSPDFSDQWPCPVAGSIGNDGNSHPYNPFNGLPVCPNCVGKNNHGGSGGTVAGTRDTGADNVNSAATGHSHATRNIDLWYGNFPVPSSRNYAVVDTEGSTAPFYCEDGFTQCTPSNS